MSLIELLFMAFSIWVGIGSLAGIVETLWGWYDKRKG
jgi:hypothetical protein